MRRNMMPMPCLAVAVAMLHLLSACSDERYGTSPTSPAASATQTLTRNGYTLVVTSGDPALPPSTVTEMVDCFFAVYPVMSARFNPNAIRTVSLVIDPARSGVASVSNGVITVAGAWMKAHPADIDVVTHEAFHIVQAYPPGQPGWAVEGLADYARDKYGVNNARGGWSLPNYSSSQKYTDSYRVTARFFKWLEIRVHSTILERLDGAMRNGQYSDRFWVQETGKSIDERWADYAADPSF